MKYYNGIDLARVIAAFLVVCIHTDPLMTYSPTGNYFLVSVIARLAVPFFFLVSGFFFGRKLHLNQPFRKDLPMLFSVLKRLLTIYLAWLLIYLPLQLLAWKRSGDSWTYWLSFLQKSIFEGSYYTLWYLTALIFATAFSYILFKLLQAKTALLITFCLFVVGTLLQSYYDVWQAENLFSSYYEIFLTTRNGLFFGSFFVSLGIFISQRKSLLLQRWNVIFFLLSLILLSFEAFQLQHLEFTKGSGMWLMLAPATYFLFKSLQNLHIKDWKSLHYFRPFSLLVYLSHGLFLIIFNRIFQINPVVYFVIVIFSTSILSAAIIYWSRRFPLLKKLY